MAINIIDGFYLGSATPIDSRFVVANTTERTAIEYKYDGLKVFQRDNRTTYIWNSSTSIWEVEGSGALSGTGTSNYVPRWTSGSSLGTSSIYSSYPNIGLNNTTPLSLFDIKDPSGSESLALNVRKISGSQDSVVIGYNWYYDSADARVNSLKPSTKIEFGSTQTILSFQTRVPSSPKWEPILELSNGDGYNFLRSLDKGNFISGSVSFSSSAIPTMSAQLVYVNGSMRTSSSIHNSVNFVSQTAATYVVSDSDHEVVFSPLVNFTVILPTPNAVNLGRILELSNNSSNRYFLLSPSAVAVDGTVFGGAVMAGEKIKLLVVLDGLIYKWKITEIITPHDTITLEINNQVLTTQNNIMNNLVPARTWISVPNYPTAGTALTLGPIYIYVFMGGTSYLFTQMAPGYSLSNVGYGAGRAKFRFQITTTNLYDVTNIFMTKDSLGKVTLSGGVLQLTNIAQTYVKYNSGTPGSNAYTEGNSVGGYLIWRIATLSVGWRPNTSQNNISVPISIYVGANINQTLDGYLVVKSDGSVYIQYRVPLDANTLVGMEVYLPPVSWYT